MTSLLASASFDVTARLWDRRNKHEALKFIGHGPVIAASRGSDPGLNSVDFLVDGRRVVTGGMDGKVKIWDVDTGRELLSLDGHTCLAMDGEPPAREHGNSNHTDYLADHYPFEHDG